METMVIEFRKTDFSNGSEYTSFLNSYEFTTIGYTFLDKNFMGYTNEFHFYGKRIITIYNMRLIFEYYCYYFSFCSKEMYVQRIES